MTTPQPKPTDPLLGQRLDGRYLITGVLGKGGMGIVYAGVHEQLGREVAIKVLSSATAAEPVVVERFVREARIASGLGHGNIVDVSDLGQLPDGRPYLVMPRIRGTAFSELLAKKGAQPPSRVVELLRGVAAALDLVHAKGLVHRDVKPENLMHVVREDGSETVMLMDFGIAMLMSQDAARLTHDGMVCGTPAYLAPETARGEEADHRADVYALATVAFELLTGRLPFEADNPQRVLGMKAFRDPPRLETVARTPFSAAVETVIARGLARLPEERYLTASAFVRALEIAIDPDAASRAPAPTEPIELAGAPIDRPPTESLELPLGSSDRLQLDVEEATTTLPQARPAELEALERAPTMRTPSSAPPPPPPRARAGLLAVLSVAAVLFASGGLAVLLDSPPPPPAGPAAPERAAQQAPAVTLDLAPEPQVEAQTEPPPAPEARDPAASPPAAEPRRNHAKAPRPPQPQAKGAQQPAQPGVDELMQEASRAFMSGQLARAAELYEQVTVRAPAHTAAWRGLALMSERLGRKRTAVRAYRRALRLAPNGAEAKLVRERLAQLGAPSR